MSAISPSMSVPVSVPECVGSMKKELMTPDWADELLKNSEGTNFRKLKFSIWRRYSSDLVAGRWTDDGSPIRLTEDGSQVWDGQHRLRAIVDSGISLWLWVYRGPKNDINVDIAPKRTPGDYLRREGFVNTNLVSALARIVICHERDCLHTLRSASITNSEVLECVRRHPKIPEYVRIAGRLNQMTKGSVLGYVIYAGCELAASRPSETAEKFVEELLHGVSLPDGSPTLLLRNRLINNKTNKAKLDSEEIAALTIKAWNAWISGQSIRLLRWRNSKDSYAEPFPKVI